MQGFTWCVSVILWLEITVHIVSLPLEHFLAFHCPYRTRHAALISSRGVLFLIRRKFNAIWLNVNFIYTMRNWNGDSFSNTALDVDSKKPFLRTPSTGAGRIAHTKQANDFYCAEWAAKVMAIMIGTIHASRGILCERCKRMCWVIVRTHHHRRHRRLPLHTLPMAWPLTF